MKQRERTLESLEQKLEGVQPPTAEDIGRYCDWLFRQLVIGGFTRWLRAERPEGYKELTEGLIAHRRRPDGQQEVVDKVLGKYRDAFLAAGSPLVEMDSFLHSWGMFVGSNPDLANRREPSFEQIMAVLEAH
jgi:hypothetical protein